MKSYDEQPRKLSGTKRGKEMIATVLVGLAFLSYTFLHFWLFDHLLPTWLNALIIGALWIVVPYELELCVALLIRLIWGRNAQDKPEER
jgi:hypothetical protein